MRALLVQQKVLNALDDQVALAKTKTPEEIAKIQEIVFSNIILYLGNNVLGQIHEAKNVL